MATVHHRYATVRGRQLFYREAGPAGAPPASQFSYTFDALAGLTADLLGQLGITAIITQNGNGYEAGFVEDFWKPVREFWQDRIPQT